ncbi:hypothetical protein MUK42_03647 [Musa troglodytarum]|uniref:Uncharacterized protein n=1 Tax=Musa troglodytarum TaxID=320322 RepID=A0A9E7GX90_9LILI|nr:hypothetical protein MUK42_03647 [Musa troglodytarum]
MQAKRRSSRDRVEGANGEINLVQMEKKHLEEPDSQNGKISFYTVGKGEIVEESWDTDMVLGEEAGEDAATVGSGPGGSLRYHLIQMEKNHLEEHYSQKALINGEGEAGAIEVGCGAADWVRAGPRSSPCQP